MKVFTSPYLWRLNRDGSLDTSFAITGLNTVYQAVPTADGKIVADGTFSLVGNRCIARFNSDGSYDTSFTANTTNVRYGVMPWCKLISLVHQQAMALTIKSKPTTYFTLGKHQGLVITSHL